MGRDPLGAKKESLLAIYGRFVEETKNWERECGDLDRGR